MLGRLSELDLPWGARGLRGWLLRRDGVAVARFPDGVLMATHADGTTMRTAADGAMILVEVVKGSFVG